MIKSIQFDCERLGKLNLDFVNSKDNPFTVIVLAGENGCGKTTILDDISYLFKNHELGEIDTISYTINGYEVTLRNRKYNKIEYYKVGKSKKWEPIALSVFDDNKSKYNICEKGFAYSKARSGFRLGGISSVLANDVDSNKNDFDNDDYSDIKQLLVDINSIDANNFYIFSQSKSNLTGVQITEEFNKVSRMSRFRQAFNTFFDTIQFDKIGNPVNKSFPILFKKHNKIIDIDNLSTGEKQIVCRGGRLLKNVGKMDDAIVLIDEPELSLHPTWQRKILDFYCDLFKKENKQIAQVIIATHSEYVIESALKRNDCLVIVLKDDQGTIKAEKIVAPDILGTITSSEINYKAFNIYSIDYHDALYSFYQQRIGTESSIEMTDNSIYSSPHFDSQKHLKIDNYRNRTYQTLPTYIRNAIHHPDNPRVYSSEDLKESTELLRKLCR